MVTEHFQRPEIFRNRLIQSSYFLLKGSWKLADAGEFSNIKNNPLWQAKNFSPVKARYIKFRALRNIDGNDEIGYAEVDVITQ